MRNKIDTQVMSALVMLSPVTVFKVMVIREALAVRAAGNKYHHSGSRKTLMIV
jgi:hypothetical protein